MKTLQIISKSKATKLLTESLFHKGGTYNKMKWCTGKYASNMLGEEIPVPENIKALWTERRQDMDGVYYIIMCLTA